MLTFVESFCGMRQWRAWNTPRHTPWSHHLRPLERFTTKALILYPHTTTETVGALYVSNNNIYVAVMQNWVRIVSYKSELYYPLPNDVVIQKPGQQGGPVYILKSRLSSVQRFLRNAQVMQLKPWIFWLFSPVVWCIISVSNAMVWVNN
jgi:hypothetical protein